jgi:hypothetical protein
MSSIFIILGMHRTATSTMAEGLLRTGVHMGDRMLGPGHGNPKGHFEDMDFLILNEQILRDAGGAWNKPPSECAILSAAEPYGTFIEEMINKKSQRKCWGWKDPRTVLTVKCYLPYLRGHQIFISACFRDPADVAKSLSMRDNSKYCDNLHLAHEYHRRLMGFIQEWYQSLSQ